MPCSACRTWTQGLEGRGQPGPVPQGQAWGAGVPATPPSGEERPGLVVREMLGSWLRVRPNPFSPQRRKSRYAELDFEVGPGVPSPRRLGPGVFRASGQAAQAGRQAGRGPGRGPLPRPGRPGPQERAHRRAEHRSGRPLQLRTPARPPPLQKIMHTRKRHQDMFQDLNRKLQHAEKDKEVLGPESKVWGSGQAWGSGAGLWALGGADEEDPSGETPPPSDPIHSFLYSPNLAGSLGGRGPVWEGGERPGSSSCPSLQVTPDPDPVAARPWCSLGSALHLRARPARVSLLSSLFSPAPSVSLSGRRWPAAREAADAQ